MDANEIELEGALAHNFGVGFLRLRAEDQGLTSPVSLIPENAQLFAFGLGLFIRIRACFEDNGFSMTLSAGPRSFHATFDGKKRDATGDTVAYLEETGAAVVCEANAISIDFTIDQFYSSIRSRFQTHDADEIRQIGPHSYVVDHRKKP